MDIIALYALVGLITFGLMVLSNWGEPWITWGHFAWWLFANLLIWPVVWILAATVWLEDHNRPVWPGDRK